MDANTLSTLCLLVSAGAIVRIILELHRPVRAGRLREYKRLMRLDAMAQRRR